MKRIGYTSLAVFALALGLTAVASAQTPNPNGAFTFLRYWNSCPVSDVTLTNSYPSNITITDNDPYSFAGWNKHLWKFSEDGGATQATFHNYSNYSFCADFVIDGNDPDNLEGGIEISPWWSDGDGQFMVNGNSGEIAVFGGRLPFFTFTSAVPNPPYSLGFGVTYVKGTTAHLSMTYISGPAGPSSSAPATVQYDLVYAGTPYSSGARAFDQGNPAEDPPHGQWGSLEPTSVGGYAQCGHMSTQPTTASYSWSNICYSNLQSTPAKSATWGSLKALYR
jgi:hypothetical protein